MVHYLNILHSQHLHSLLNHLFGISTQPIIQLDEIVVISIEPLTLASVNLNNFVVKLINLLFQRFYPVVLIACWVGMLFQDVLFIFFYLFYLVLDVRAIVQKHGVY